MKKLVFSLFAFIFTLVVSAQSFETGQFDYGTISGNNDLDMLSAAKLSANYADHISLNTANENALKFINARIATGHKTMHKAPLSQTDLNLCAVRPNMYIFNVGRSEGFVVTSASSLTHPVLCYSPDGQWDDNVSEALGWLFEQYDAEIAEARQKDMKATSSSSTISKRPIEPLIKTLWHQWEPYNEKLTAFTRGGNTYHVPTGCVATAMAQIMNYHQWPKTIKQDIPGYNHGQVVGDDAVEVKIDGVPAGTVIDWDNMNEEIVWPDSRPEAIEAVSNLMYYCGAAVKMYYSELESSSHNLTAMYALKHYFDYDPTIYIANRANYSYYDWCNMLYGELSAGRPILYNGQSNYGGHSFIIDGYDGNEMFHFNLGWAGATSSVYAILSSVGHNSAVDNPDAYDSPDGYVYHQSAVMNVQKAGLSDGVYHVSLTCDVGCTGETINCTYYNNEDESYTFDLGIGYRDADGNIQVVQATEGVEMLAGSAKSQQYAASSMSLPSGTYRLLPIARLSGGRSDWQFISNELDYQIATVSADGVVTLTEHNRLADLSTETITFSGLPYAGEEQYVFCNIQNKGEEDFFDKLYFFWNDNPANKGIDAGHYRLWSHATINAGGTAPVEFYFTPDKAGEYTVWITTDYHGENVVGQATISVDGEKTFDVSNQTPVTISNVKVSNFENGSILGNDVAVELDITNTSSTDYFRGGVNMNLSLYIGEDWYGVEAANGGVAQYYDIAPNQTRHLQFLIPDIDPGYDVSFYLVIPGKDDVYTSEIYHMEPAALGYTPGGVKTPFKATATLTIPEWAGAVDLTMVAKTVKKVVPNSNPNTIYYLNAGDAVPEGLEGRNVIIGDQAEKITLDGTYGVAVPKQFTANAVSFTKQFVKNKWSTLCLPFSISNNSHLTFAEITDENANHIQAYTTNRVAAYQTYFVKSTTDEAQTLTGTNVLFPKQDNAIATINNFKAQGVMGATTVMNAYVLNDDGSTLSLKSSAQVQPFTSFFMVSKRGYAPSSAVTIDVAVRYDLNGDGKVSTADIQVIINEMKKPQASQNMDYDLNGDGKISTADIQVIINEMKK